MNPVIMGEQTASGFWQYSGSTAKLRVFALEDFRSADGVYYPAGPVSARDSCFLELPVTVNGDKSLTIPSTDKIPFTTNSTRPSVRLTAHLYDSRNVRRNAFLSDFRVHEQLGATTSWHAVALMNTAQPAALGNNYLSATATLQLLAAQAGASNPASTTALGRVLMDVAPADAAAPTAVGANSQKLAARRGVNVALLATAGAGTEASPYTGWDAAIGAWASNTVYDFGDKHFSFSTPIVVLDTDGTRFVGAGTRAARLKFTGTGVAVTFKHTGLGGGLRCGIENIEIDGNANCTRGLMVEAQSDFTCRNVNVRNCTQAAFWVRFSVRGLWEQCRSSWGADVANGFTTYPVLGFYTEQRGGGETFQDNTLIGCVFGGMTGSGMEFNHAVNNVVLNGAVEGCGGGVVVNNTSYNNSFVGMNNEYNTAGDWDIYGNQTNLVGVLSVGDHVTSPGLTRIRSGARSTRISGGRLDTLQVDSGALNTVLDNIGINISGSGVFTNGDGSTEIVGQIYNITAGGSGGGNTNPLSNSALNLGLAYGAGPAWDTATYAVVNLGGLAALIARRGTTGGINVPVNAYLDSLGAWRYRVTGAPASNVQQFAGDIIFMTAPAGIADATITWTEVGKFDSDGKLYVNDGGTLKGVTYGAADSGGAGFKVMRIAN